MLASIRYLSILCALFAVTGCSSLNSSSAVSVLNGVQIYADDGEKGFVFVLDTDASRQFCLSPTPDAVAYGSSGLSMELAVPSHSEGVSEGNSTGVVALGGRSSGVLVAREFFYRACEFSINHKLTKAEAQVLYLKNLDILQAVLSADTNTGTSGFSATPACVGESCPSASSMSSTATTDTDNDPN